MSDILVLGAGMVGVSTALALQDHGHSVTLVDRRAPGSETSTGNAGIIQAEAAEPYAMPRDLATLLGFALGRSNDLTYSLRGLAGMAPALWSYFRASAPRKHAETSRIYTQLTSRATGDHAPLIAATGLDNLVSRSGLAMLFREGRDFDSAAKDARRLHDSYGVASEVHDGASWARAEPALRRAPAGVVHYTDSWSVADPGALTAGYAALFKARGGSVKVGDAGSLRQSGSHWDVTTESGQIAAQHVVLCLGPWTPALLKRFGTSVPMIWKRGYNAHFSAPLRPRVPFLDAANGVVIASMSKGLRVTSGAALVPMDAPAEPRQIARAEARVNELIRLGPRIGEPQWFGTRPCLPNMLPMVGPIPEVKGLWANFGHGHQGLTLGPTTARLLAEGFDGDGTELHARLSPETQLA